MEKKQIQQFMLSIIAALTLVSTHAQTIQDTTPPVIYNCPQRDNFILTQHGFVFANLGEPTAVDFQSPPVRMERTIAPGFYVDVGFSQNVTYTFTDRAGNKAQCSFAVHAVAFVHCQAMTCQNGATCIKDQVLDEAHLCICPVGHSGKFCENVDNEPPVVRNCPTQEFVAFAPDDGGDSSTLVSWIEPFATDNGPLVAIDKTNEPLSGFPPGRTEVTYTFADAARNVVYCTFSVMIYVGDWKLYDGEKPSIYNCPSTNVVVPLPLGSTESVIGWIEPYARDNSGKIPTKKNNIAPRETFSLGRTRVQYTFTDEQDNSAICAFDIILINTEQPQNLIQDNWDIVNCPISTIMANIPANKKSVVVMWNEPTAVGRTGLSFTVNKTHTPGEGFPVGGTEVVYRFRASDGSVNECKFAIYISQGIDQTNPAVIADRSHEPVIHGCPSDIEVTLPYGTEEAIVDWGEPKAYSPVKKAIRISRSRQPNSRFATNLQNPDIVQYVFTDSDGLSSTCSFSVDLNTGPMEFIVPDNDNTPPKIYDCPGDLEAELDYSNTATVSWIEPYATDDTGVTPTQNANHRPFERFFLGQTDVKYTFTDLSGNTAECSFTITVNAYEDIQPPRIINCINSFTIGIKSFSIIGSIRWVEPYATDNTGITPARDRTHQPGDMLPLGVTTVTYTFTDMAKNKATCSFDITVVAEPTCEHNRQTYQSFDSTIHVNQCSECLCVVGDWYCRKKCDLKCPLIYPSDIGICNDFGGPESPQTFCNSDADCPDFGSKCCIHICGGGRYCTKPEGTSCSARGLEFRSGQILRTVESEKAYECPCSLGEFHCKETKSCMYNNRRYYLEESRASVDGCNTCSCSDGSWVCTEKECETQTCTYNDQQYSIGDTRTDEDGCSTCTCTASGWSCTEIACEPRSCIYNGRHYLIGESRTDDDNCNTCTCLDSGWLCTELLVCGRTRASSSFGASCLYDGVTYESGAIMSIGGCTNCQCLDATLSCTPSVTCPIGRKRRSTRNWIENVRMKSIENIGHKKSSRTK